MKNIPQSLIMIVFFSAIFRLFALGSESLWWDEMSSVDWAQQTLGGMWSHMIHYDTHPPLYFLVLHYWILLFGKSEIALRLPSVIFGLASVWLIYFVGQIVFDKETGLIAALFLGFSSFHLFYSQEARMYSMFGFFFLSSMYSLFQMFQNERRLWRWLYCLSFLASFYCQYIGVFLLIVHNACYFLQEKTLKKCLPLRSWLKLQFAVIIPMLLWIPVILRQLNGPHLSWIQPATLGHVAEVLFEFCGAFPIISGQIPSLQYDIIPGILAFCFLILFVSSFVSACKGLFRFGDSQPALSHFGFVFVWVFLPMAILFAVSVHLFPIFIARACIPAFFSVLIFSAKKLSLCPEKLKKVVLLLCTTFFVLNLYDYATVTKKTDWRSAAAFMDTSMEKEAVIFFSDTAIIIRGAFAYYSTRGDIKKFEMNPEEETFEECLRDLKEKSRGKISFWVVCAYFREEGEKLPDLLAKYFKLKQMKEFPGVTLCCFEI